MATISDTIDYHWKSAFVVQDTVGNSCSGEKLRTIQQQLIQDLGCLQRELNQDSSIEFVFLVSITHDENTLCVTFTTKGNDLESALEEKLETLLNKAIQSVFTHGNIFQVRLKDTQLLPDELQDDPLSNKTDSSNAEHENIKHDEGEEAYTSQVTTSSDRRAGQTNTGAELECSRWKSAFVVQDTGGNSCSGERLTIIQQQLMQDRDSLQRELNKDSSFEFVIITHDENSLCVTFRTKVNDSEVSALAEKLETLLNNAIQSVSTHDDIFQLRIKHTQHLSDEYPDGPLCNTHEEAEKVYPSHVATSGDRRARQTYTGAEIECRHWRVVPVVRDMHGHIYSDKRLKEKCTLLQKNMECLQKELNKVLRPLVMRLERCEFDREHLYVDISAKGRSVQLTKLDNQLIQVLTNFSRCFSKENIELRYTTKQTQPTQSPQSRPAGKRNDGPVSEHNSQATQNKGMYVSDNMMNTHLIVYIEGSSAQSDKFEIKSDHSAVQISNNSMEFENGLWTCNLESMRTQECTVKIVKKGSVRTAFMSRTVGELRLDASEIQRDIIGKPTENAVSAHVKDIIRQCTEHTLKSSVTEMESIMLRRFQGFNIIADLCNFEREYHPLRTLLKGVGIGLVIYVRDKANPNIPPPKELENVSDDFLKAINSTIKMDDLPSSCQTYIPKVCELVCRAKLKDEMCIVAFICHTLFFLGEDVLDKYDYKCNLNLICKSNNCLDKIRHVLGSLLLRSEAKTSEAASSLIKRLVCHFPWRICIEIERQFESSPPPDEIAYLGMLQVMMKEANTKFDEEIQSILTINQLITVVWETKYFKIYKEKENDCTSVLIQLLCQTVTRTSDEKPGSIDRDSAKKLIELCQNYGFCSTQLEKLLELLASSEDDFLFSLFYDIVRRIDLTVCEETCLKWLENTTNKRPMKINHLPNVYCKVSNIFKQHMAKQAVQSKLGKRMGMHLEQLGALSILCYLEKYNDREYAILEEDLFKNHLKRFLLSIEPEEILGHFKQEMDRLCISNRLVAFVVNTTIDRLEIGDSKNAFTFTLKEVFRRKKFWEMVLTAKGTEVGTIEENYCVKHIRRTLVDFSESLSSKTVRCADILELSESIEPEDLLCILCTEQANGKYLIYRWKRTTKEVEVRLQKIQKVKEVFTMQRRFQKLEPTLQQLERGMKSRETDIRSGPMTVSEMETNSVLNSISQLADSYEVFFKYVDSSIFWNVCEDLLISTVICTTESAESDFSSSFTLILAVFQRLGNEGTVMFKKAWCQMATDTSLTFQEARKFLQNVTTKVDIGKEISIASGLGVNIPAELKKTLERINCWGVYNNKVDAIAGTLAVFNQSPKDDGCVTTAINRFKALKGTIDERVLFADVQVALKIICDIADKLLDKDETVDVLMALANSTLLIDFLDELKDEDVRNLIDAVEEVSEQQVQESTVSGFIEVKRFMQPLFKCLPRTEAMEYEFLDLIVSQIHQFPKDLSQKITDCMDNLHTLKSLYNNVANRSEVTKSIIENVLRRGKFEFTLQHRKCCLSVSYMHDGKESKYSKEALSDFRSSALLLMNTDKMDQDERKKIESFVSEIDLCSDIERTITALHKHGHRAYTQFSHKSARSKLSELQTKVSKDLQIWKKHLEDCRTRHYFLNFIHGDQLHTFFGFYKTGENAEMVRSMLKFINPNSEVKKPSDLFIQDITLQSDSQRDFLDFLGCTLERHICSLPPHARDITIDTYLKSSLTNVVESGRLFVAELHTNSRFVVNAVLSLYSRTVNKLPEPSQVLFCTERTAWMEIELLLNRCCYSAKHCRDNPLFCIANVEALVGDLQFQLVSLLKEMTNQTGFRLAIICRGSDRHPFLNELSLFKSNVELLPDGTVRKAFEELCPEVFTITSEVAGLGKTSFINSKVQRKRMRVKTLHISGPIRKKSLIEDIKSLDLVESSILRIDIGNVDSHGELDTILFELLILRYLFDETTCIYLPTEHVYVEIANTISDTLRNSLQTVMHFKREHLKWKDYGDFIISKEINSSTQVVCQYLHGLDIDILDDKDLQFSGANAVRPISQKRCRELLKSKFPSKPGTSHSLVHVYLNFFADQLEKMSCSTFFRTKTLTDMHGKGKDKKIKTILVKCLHDVSRTFATRSVQSCRSTQAMASDQTIALTDLPDQRVASGMGWDDSNHLLFAFHNQDKQTLSVLYRDRRKVDVHVKVLFESQLKKKEGLQDYANMDQHQLQTKLQKVARTDPLSLKKEKLIQMAKGYALTPDNLLKMILIILRIKARIPVIIMGETGCGKTSLIRYLHQICSVEFEVLSIHAGVKRSTIIDTIKTEDCKAKESLDMERWLFLDEINTCSHLGLISDVLCHHECLGKCLSPNFVVMAACNPYKLRTKQSILTSGLRNRVKTDALSRLVYRVNPLPESLVDYVWDFGSVNPKDERAYICRMSSDVCKDDCYHNAFSDLLSMSQIYIREREKTSSCVSLRDVQRCCKLAKWFQIILQTKPLKGPKYRSIPIKTCAIVLALAHCYQSRLDDNVSRRRYREKISDELSKYKMKFNESDIRDMILDEQNDILGRMNLPPGIAKNTALQENVFVLLACILNKMPIFLVGKPGCSKSLSMQVIRNNLRGKDSKDEFFKTLPQLYCVSFQGSESSTSHGILKVFEKAEKYQELNAKEDVLSLVILEEIGLAEVSRFNPLKVLHNLLENPDGKEPNVAVVGISNWALDASKMNRAIHLSRPEMNEEELVKTGEAIGNSYIEDIEAEYRRASSPLRPLTPPCYSKLSEEELLRVVQSYCKYTQDQTFENFHGLRDFYFLIKCVAKHIIKRGGTISEEDTRSIILDGLQRNFSGLPNEWPTILRTFNIQSGKDMDILSLIEDNLADGDARHLMLITTGDAVLSILTKKLDEIGRKMTLILGSHFEEDLCDDYNYRILSKIIMCMEQGIVLVLKDLETIYGSLYDMLNQNYTLIGKRKVCRVALGPYSNPICRVHDSFKFIVLIQKTNLPCSDPPFLNRFEKQFLTFKEILSPQEINQIQQLHDWISKIVTIEGATVRLEDVLPICSEDMLPSLVIQTSRTYVERGKNLDENEIVEKCKMQLLWIIQPEVIIRLRKTALEETAVRSLQEYYFSLPVHNGMNHFLERNSHSLTIIFTNSNVHARVNISTSNPKIEQLGVFKSEKQFQLKTKQFWEESEADLLIMHCSVDDDRNIPLAKTTIEDFYNEYAMDNPDGDKKAVIIIHIGRSKEGLTQTPQINFLGKWKLATLDVISEPSIPLPEFCKMSLSTVIAVKSPLNEKIRDQLFWAISRIQYTNKGRTFHDISRLLNQIKESDLFLEAMDGIIHRELKKEELVKIEENWHEHIACDAHALLTTSSFMKALEEYVMQVIKIPLAMAVFQLEKCTVLDTFLVCNERSEKLQMWKRMTEDCSIFNTNEIPIPTGPECYICPSVALVLQMPYSKVYFDRVEDSKDRFIELLDEMKYQCDVEDIDELPTQAYKELIFSHRPFVSECVVDLNEYVYEGWQDDYFEDFCNIISSTVAGQFRAKSRIKTMKWAMSTKLQLSFTDPVDVFLNIHATYWLHNSLFNAGLLFVEACGELTENELETILPEIELGADVIPKCKEEIEGQYEKAISSRKLSSEQEQSAEKCDNETNGDADDSQQKEGYFIKLVSRVCLKLLPTESTLSAFSTVGEWHFRTNRVLSWASEVTMESNVFNYMRFCNDIAAVSAPDFEALDTHLQELACIFEENTDVRLDSSDVFDNLRNFIQDNPSTAGQLWCLYTQRCCDENVATEAIPFIFQLANDNDLGGVNVNFIREPIVEFIQNLLAENEEDNFNALLSLATNDMHPICSKISDVVCTFVKGNDYVTNLVILLIDIFEYIFKDSVKEDNLEKASHILVEDIFSLRSVAAIAFCRMYLRHHVRQIKWTGISPDSDLLAIIYRKNVKFAGLREFFFKLVMHDMRISSIEKDIENYKSIAPYLADMVPPDDTLDALEDAPLEFFKRQAKQNGDKRFLSNLTQDEKTENALRRLVQKATQTSEDMLSLLAMAQCQFYLRRSKAVLNDVHKSIAETIFTYANEFEMTRSCIALLGSLIDCKAKQFRQDTLNVTAETPGEIVTRNAFITSTLAVVVSDNPTKSAPLTVFGQFFFGRLSHKPHVIPFYDASTGNGYSTKLKVDRVQCCNTLTVVKSEINKCACSVCSETDRVQTVEVNLKRPGVSSVVKCVFELLKTGTIIGSYALGMTDTDTNNDDFGTELKKDVKQSWIKLKKCTGLCDRRLGHLLHNILFKLVESKFWKSVIETVEDKHEWEADFISIVELTIQNRFAEVCNIGGRHYCDREVKAPSAEKLLLEIYPGEDAIASVSSKILYRITGEPTVEEFLSEMELGDMFDQYPFLNLVLLHRVELGLLRFAYPLIKWHQAIVNTMHFILRSNECYEITVSQFLGKNADEKKRDHIGQCFDAFKNAWEFLNTANRENDNIFGTELGHFEDDSYLKDCIMIDENSLLYRVLKHLIDTQNSFIESAMTIAVMGKCKGVKLLSTSLTQSVSVCVPMTSLRRDSFIDFRWTTDYSTKDEHVFSDDIHQFAYPSLQFGFGNRIEYDFGTIEACFARFLLLNKPIISTGKAFPKVVFKDEKFKHFDNLVNGVIQLIPQTEIPSDIKQHFLRKKSKDRQQLKNLLNDLEIIILWVVQSRAKPGSLLEFIDSRTYSVLGTFKREVLPEPKGCVSLSHIVSLHGLLEEINADGIALKDAFRVDLNQAIQSHFEQIASDSLIIAHTILSALKRFVYRCLSHDDIDGKQTIRFYLQASSFWDAGIHSKGSLTVDNSTRQIADVLPDFLLTEHTHHLIERLQTLIQDLEKKKEKGLLFTYTSIPNTVQAKKAKQTKKRKF